MAENAGSIIPFAVGQAFFTLSLGMAIMVTYSSYVGGEDNLVVDGGAIVVTNTLVGVLAGLVVFPILLTIGADITTETGGAGALFVATAAGFGSVPFGRVFGVVFFGVVLIAALSSAISLLEVTVAYANDNYDVPRTVLAPAIGVALFVLGLPSAWDTAWLTWFDSFAYQVFLPLSVLATAVFVGWVLGADAVTELREGAAGLGAGADAWLWTVRLVVVAGVTLTLALGINEMFLVEDAAVYAPF